MDHLTELPVVQSVVSARVELGKSLLHLLRGQVLTDFSELLETQRVVKMW